VPRPSPPRPPAVVQRTLRGHGPEPRREYSTDSPEAEALLAEQCLSSADLERALVRFETPRAPRFAPSSGSTRTARSGPAAKAGARTCPTRATSRLSPCSGSGSWNCSAECPRAVRRGSARTARCRAMSTPPPARIASQLSASFRSTEDQATPPRPCARRRFSFAALRQQKDAADHGTSNTGGLDVGLGDRRLCTHVTRGPSR
jgi:hypothetical protein